MKRADWKLSDKCAVGASGGAGWESRFDIYEESLQKTPNEESLTLEVIA
jgi:hypothetical protein